MGAKDDDVTADRRASNTQAGLQVCDPPHDCVHRRQRQHRHGVSARAQGSSNYQRPDPGGHHGPDQPHTEGPASVRAPAQPGSVCSEGDRRCHGQVRLSGTCQYPEKRTLARLGRKIRELLTRGVCLWNALPPWDLGSAYNRHFCPTLNSRIHTVTLT